MSLEPIGVAKLLELHRHYVLGASDTLLPVLFDP